MITILTAFKPFVGQARVHQTNALSSWKALADDVEILVFGKPEVFAPSVEPFGARVVPGIPHAEDGRARVDAIFEFGRLHGKYDRQVYVNGDIILMRDLVQAFEAIRLSQFLMVGQCINIDLSEVLSFEPESAREALRATLTRTGKLRGVWSMDYFAYLRGSIPALPPLYLGAWFWDSLMVYYCRRARVPVIDATRDVATFHQIHSDHPREKSQGPSAQANRAQVQDPACFFLTIDASHWLDLGRTRNAFSSPLHGVRMISNYPVVHGWPRPLRIPFNLAGRLAMSLMNRWRERQCWRSE